MFKKGDVVVCIWNDPWIDYETGEPAAGPAYGDICTISSVFKEGKVDGVVVKEWTSPDDRFVAGSFRLATRLDIQLWEIEKNPEIHDHG